MPRILGIDPGSVVTGYGVIDSEAGRLGYVASGCLRLPPGALAGRLRSVFEELGEIIRRYQPGEMAVEQVFVGHNITSALKLGHARGAALCAGAVAGLAVSEYAATEVKLSVTGNGRAEKPQVQHMVRILLGLRGRLQTDAADALAVAVCHANRQATRNRAGLPLGRRRR